MRQCPSKHVDWTMLTRPVSTAPGSYVLKSEHSATVYSEEQKNQWEQDPEAYDAYRRGCEDEYNFQLFGCEYHVPDSFSALG